MRLYSLLFFLALSLFFLWRSEAQIIPLTISRAGGEKLNWTEAVFHCLDEYKVSESKSLHHMLCFNDEMSI